MEENGVIRFNGVSGPEAGGYICTATNAVGTVTATATLNIVGGMWGLFFYTHDHREKNARQRNYNTVYLFHSKGKMSSSPESNIVWHCWKDLPCGNANANNCEQNFNSDDVLFMISVTNASCYKCKLFLSNLCDREDIGCNPSNILIFFFSGRLGVQISQPSPYNVRAGQRVSFECTASDPSASVYWEYPDRRQPAPGGVADVRVWCLLSFSTWYLYL